MAGLRQRIPIADLLVGVGCWTALLDGSEQLATAQKIVCDLGGICLALIELWTKKISVFDVSIGSEVRTGYSFHL